MIDWPEKTLGEICEKITDGAHSSPKSVLIGKPMASVKDLNSFGVDLISARKIAEEDYQKLVKQGCKPCIGDVLIAKDGNTALDTVCVQKENEDFVLLSSVAILRPNNREVMPDFLKYYFSNRITISYLKSNFISGAAIPRVVLKDFKKAVITLPPLSKQRAIVSVLSALDDKIENNRQMNETLEEMARAIFKSWFVDFDPVHAKAAGKAPAHMDDETAALFPSSFGDNGLPVGWESKELGSLSEILNGFAFKSSDYVKEGLFVLRTKNFGDARSAERLSDDVYLPEKFAESHQKYLSEPFDFHVVMVAASLGKTSYIFPHLLPALRNQNMWCFRPKSSFPYRFFLNFSIEEKISHVIGWGSGSARDFFKKSDFVRHRITVCENSILDQFETTASSFYKKIAANHHQNETLVELRDTLLPKLMSGEIRVSDAEREVEAAV